MCANEGARCSANKNSHRTKYLTLANSFAILSQRNYVTTINKHGSDHLVFTFTPCPCADSKRQFSALHSLVAPIAKQIVFRHLSRIQGATPRTRPVFCPLLPSMPVSHLSARTTDCCSLGEVAETLHHPEGAFTWHRVVAVERTLALRFEFKSYFHHLLSVRPQANVLTILSHLICKRVLAPT